MGYFLIFVIVQIVLESLPVSSSGHISLLTLWFIKTGRLHVLPYIPSSFYFFLHGPTALVILLFFIKRRTVLVQKWQNYPVSTFNFLGSCIIIEMVTVFFYVVFEFIGMSFFPVSVGFVVTAIALLSLPLVPDRVTQPLHYAKAAVLGAIQGASLLPGVSRFGAVYAGGRWLGLTSSSSFVFAMLIQLPLIFAGFCKGVWDILHEHHLMQLLSVELLLVMVGATVVAYGLLVWMASLVQRDKVWLFGWYALIPALLWNMLLQ